MLLWSIRNNYIVLKSRCGHFGIIVVQELIDVPGEDVELDVVEHSARCISCGFKQISNVQLIYVRASEYALQGADTKPEDDEIGSCCQTKHFDYVFCATK